MHVAPHIFSLVAAVAGMTAAWGEEEPPCRKCMVIREENKHKNFNDGYIYFEDYEQERKQATSAQSVEEKQTKTDE